MPLKSLPPLPLLPPNDMLALVVNGWDLSDGGPLLFRKFLGTSLPLPESLIYPSLIRFDPKPLPLPPSKSLLGGYLLLSLKLLLGLPLSWGG